MPSKTPTFAIWVTGLPASGKSTLVAELVREMAGAGVEPAVLESDVLRPVFTPRATYQESDRELFYEQMAYVGALLVQHGVPVIFDATANRRSYRERARQEIARFLEVYVECPLKTCMERDPKGIYRKGREGATDSVPGLHTEYEKPLSPDVVVRCEQETMSDGALRVLACLRERGFLP